MIILGLTGNIATGKSTIAKVFKNLGVKVFDDDSVVNKITSSQRMVKYFEKNFNEVICNDKIDKKKLKNLVLQDINKLKQLEEIIHPLVNLKRDLFILKNKILNRKGIIMFDCPLLFEVGINKQCNFVIVTHCSLKEQKKRALARDNLTENEFNFILERQLKSDEKVKRADFSINTDNSLKENSQKVEKIILEITKSCNKSIF